MNWVIKLSKKVIEFFCLLVLLPFNRFIRKEYYVFYSPIGFTGNVKYIYDFFSSKGINVIFITAGSLSYFTIFKLLIRTKYVFLSHGMGYLPLTIFLTKRIQLWHGLPIKKILLDYHGDVNKTKMSIFNILLKYAYRLRIRYSYNELVTSDSILGIHLMNSMGFPARKVKFFGTASICQAKIVASEIRQTKICDADFKVLYMPTWRDGKDDVSSILKELMEYNDFWRENNIQIHCKLHPMDLKYIDVKSSLSNIKIIEKTDDIIDLIANYECLLTDYSSVCFEYTPFNRPIIFYTPDLEEYFNNRESYIDIDDFYKEQPKNINQLKEVLLSAKNGKAVTGSLKYLCGDNCDTFKKIYDFYVNH